MESGDKSGYLLLFGTCIPHHIDISMHMMCMSESNQCRDFMIILISIHQLGLTNHFVKLTLIVYLINLVPISGLFVDSCLLACYLFM